MCGFAEFLYIDKKPVNVQNLMRVLKILARPGERDGDLRAQALVFTAIASAHAESGQPVMVEWIEKTLLFSRSRVSGAVTALYRKALIQREEMPAAVKGWYYVYSPSFTPVVVPQPQAP